MKPSYVCIAIVFLTSISQIKSAKIAVPLFVGGASHFFMMEPIGQQLEARGHTVTYLMCSIEPRYEKIHVKSKIVYHTTKYPKDYIVKGFVRDTIKYGKPDGRQQIRQFVQVMEVVRDVCDALLENQDVIQKLQGYDMVFADNSLFGCGNLLKEKVNIPYIVDFSCWGMNDIYNWQYGVTWPLSYVPGQDIHYSKEYGIPFFWRIANTLAYLFISQLSKVFIQNTGSLQSKYNIASDKKLSELVSETDLVLIPVDWTLEFVRPMAPNARIIGPTTPKPSKPLPNDLEQFMQSASKGVVLVSFGSMASHLDDKRAGILSEAFSMLKYKVLWKYDQPFPDVKNIKTVQWIPQNDILGHSRLKLFMTHGGMNSMYEAAYHGVPMLMTPLWGDQPGNADKVKVAGIGESVDIKTGANFTAEMIANLINKILDNPKYKANAVRVSKLLRDRRRTPAEEGADWIEYVLRNNGTRHLRPNSTQLPFYQYFLLDVIALLIIVVFVLLYIICKILKLIKSGFAAPVEERKSFTNKQTFGKKTLMM